MAEQEKWMEQEERESKDGKQKKENTLLEWTRAHGAITRRDVMALLDLSDTAAYARLHRLAERGELEQVGRK